MPPIHYLFVYGTLRKAHDGSLHAYLKDRATFSDTATLPGKLYEIAGYPGAVMSISKPINIIHGEVYRLLQPEAVLQTLDAYEECSVDFPQPHEYRRAQQTVTLSTGKLMTAWVYLYQHPVCRHKMIANGDYAAYLPQKHC